MKSMRTIKYLSLAMLCVAAMTSCQSREDKIKSLITENFTQTLDEPSSLKILSIAQPDSAFGLRYFTSKEKGLVFKSMKEATECLMERTCFMTAPNMNDDYAMTIADLEMQVSSNVYGSMLGDSPKGAFSGWKVRTVYTAKSKYGCDYQAERWCFIDKDCKTVIKYFDLPIVGGHNDKAAIKREKSDARINSSKREQARPKVKTASKAKKQEQESK